MDAGRPERAPAIMTVPAAETRASDRRGAILMSLSMFCFILNDTVTKLLSTTVGIGEFVFLRGLFATAMIFGLVTITGHFRRLHLALDRVVVIRALFDLLATGLFIAALFHMPLPNVTAVMQAVPVTATLMTMVLFKERVEAWRLATIAVGLVGVLLIIKPGSSAFDPAIVLAAAAMVAVAIRDLVTRRIGSQIPSAVVTLTTAFLVMLGGAGWSAVEGLQPMAPQTAMALALAAVFLIAGQLLMVQAVRAAGIAATTPFRYTNVVWALVLGWAIFGFIPDFLCIHRHRADRRQRPLHDSGANLEAETASMVSPRFVIILIAALLLAGAAASARELGRASVGGREIAIFEDRTWRFVDDLAPSPKDCPAGEVSSRRLALSLCVKNGTWTSQGERYFFESLFTDPTSAAYAGIVTEAAPLTTQQMKDLVLATVKDNPRDPRGTGRELQHADDQRP